MRKRCPRCSKKKDGSKFYKNPKTPTGLASWCKACHLAADKERRERPEVKKREVQRRKQHRKDHPEVYRLRSKKEKLAKHGLTIEDYERLLAEQRGGCALCGSTDRLCVDHDHETGRVRGILCFKCNTAIGMLGDSAAGLRRAFEYLDAMAAIVSE